MSAFLSRADMSEIKRKVEFYLSVHRFEAAEKLLQAALANHGQVANLYNLLGVTYHQQSKFSEAIKLFKQAAKANPSYVEASLNLAATLCDLSQYEAAQEVFATLSAQIDEELRVPKLILGRIANQHAENGSLYDQSGLLDRALIEYERALELFPKMPDVKLALARLHFRRGALEKARSQLEELIEQEPAMIQARVLLGIVLYKMGRSDLAKGEWGKAMKANPDDLTTRAYIKLSNQWQ